MTSTASPEQKTRRGRPRDDEAWGRIFDATIHELAHTSYSSLTLDSVASRAGVARSTIYRRYATKFELVAAAVHRETVRLEPSSTGDLRADLVDFLTQFHRNVTSRPIGRVLLNLGVESLNHPEIGQFVAADSTQRLRSVTRLFEEARARGELRDDADVSLATDLLVSVSVSWQIGGRTPPADFAEPVVDLILRGIQKTPDGGARQ